MFGCYTIAIIDYNTCKSSFQITNAAVLVWIHGGGFSQGSGSQTDYNGEPLSAVGDVIHINVNYRLATFGYLTTGTLMNQNKNHSGRGLSLLLPFTLIWKKCWQYYLSTKDRYRTLTVKLPN